MTLARRSCASDLDLGATAPRAARRLCDDVLRQWGVTDEEALSAVQLIVSELVTNVVDHAGAGGGSTTLELVLDGDLVRVAVLDHSPVVPQMRAASEDDTDGRGLRIVELLSVRWGAERHTAGKRVFAEVQLDAPVDPARATDGDADSLLA